MSNFKPKYTCEYCIKELLSYRKYDNHLKICKEKIKQENETYKKTIEEQNKLIEEKDNEIVKLKKKCVEVHERVFSKVAKMNDKRNLVFVVVIDDTIDVIDCAFLHSHVDKVVKEYEKHIQAIHNNIMKELLVE